MPILRVVDIETTGLNPPAEIIEVGQVDVVANTGTWSIGPQKTALYRPINGIPPETMAVHHITPAMVAAEPVCEDGALSHQLMGGALPDVFVAHNCSFERGFIKDAVVGNKPWICTHKSSLRLWPDAVGHSNQVLRYWLNLDLGEEAMPPHRAGPDAYVTANLLLKMLEIASVDQLIAWSGEPKLIPRMPFGKHRNARWADIPSDYLDWMTRQTDMDADIVWNAQQELNRR